MIIDEASRDCLGLIVVRRFRHEDVLAALAELFVLRAPPPNMRSDNVSEFIAIVVQKWLAQVGVKTPYITPASPREDGYNESFNESLRDELLNGEIYYSLAETKVLIEAWRRHYKTIHPHSSLGYRPPAPEGGNDEDGNNALTFYPDHSVGPVRPPVVLPVALRVSRR